MICSVCQKNEAKVHVTQIVDDKMQKVDLCEECSKAKGVTDPKGFSLADLLLGLGASQEAEARVEGDHAQRLTPLGEDDPVHGRRFPRHMLADPQAIGVVHQEPRIGGDRRRGALPEPVDQGRSIR